MQLMQLRGVHVRMGQGAGRKRYMRVPGRRRAGRRCIWGMGSGRYVRGGQAVHMQAGQGVGRDRGICGG